MGRIFWGIVEPTTTTNLYNHPRNWVLDVNTANPSEEEIAKAIQNQFKTKKNGKAPGPDGIPAEILKETTQMLYAIYAKVCEEQTIPEDCKNDHLVKIPKRGDLANCNNYSTRKNRQPNHPALAEIVRDQQMGFRMNSLALTISQP